MEACTMHISKSLYVSEFVKAAETSTQAENRFFWVLAVLNCTFDFIITWIANLDIPLQFLRGWGGGGVTKSYFTEKLFFRKNCMELWAFDGIYLH
jgi:hypothetical protein